MRRAHGFTLVELIVVIVLIGVMGGSMVMYLRPALNAYFAVGRRAELTNQADTTLRLMVSEIRSAVPNSLRSSNAQNTCFELVPTSDGGRFRTAPDSTVASGTTAYIDSSEAVTQFDVLTGFSKVPAANDYVVIGNQNTSDVYSLSNVGQIDSVATLADDKLGRYRITLKAAQQFPVGYDGGRFVIVPFAKQAVSYFCSNPGIDKETGTGTGTLYRFSGYGFSANATCPPLTATTPVVATKVASCAFLYQPDGGATQQSGYMQMSLQLSDQAESVTLSYGAHVDNVP